ncbi:hypothetical protein ACHAWF_013412 [Thalassiosira exigua]
MNSLNHRIGIDALHRVGQELQSFDREKRSDEIRVHAWLLIWSWAFLIPLGALVSTHTKKHRARGQHPHFHVIYSGVLGFVLALAGFAYGIDKFSTFSRDGVSTYRTVHAVLGSIATAGMILEVLLLGLMRERNFGGMATDSPLWQYLGHFSHRYMGYLWIAFGLMACETGTHISDVLDEGANEKYSRGLIGALGATAALSVAIVQVYDHFSDTEATVAPQPYKTPKKQEESLAAGDVETPPREAFEIGELEGGMEDVAISQ